MDGITSAHNFMQLQPAHYGVSRWAALFAHTTPGLKRMAGIRYYR
ncbi:hypothetical protein [Mucilaginibacter sp. FT3.2]|nr:hypothetical protein [Mucilaginibacter sp. FT3.2]MBB6230967.1 hypothetical protein [Mucilaginibacter sp. FT3.2]